MSLLLSRINTCMRERVLRHCQTFFYSFGNPLLAVSTKMLQNSSLDYFATCNSKQQLGSGRSLKGGVVEGDTKHNAMTKKEEPASLD